MKERSIPRFDPGYILPSDAEFEVAVQYTHRYVINPGRGQNHYRYRRYRETLDLVTPGKRRLVHVDIGSGAGLFSWAFLDWASAKGLDLRRIRLYGFDHNQPSLSLAKQIRKRLTENIDRYPKLRYYDDVDTLVGRLAQSPSRKKDFVITLGYVLVQAHSPEVIQLFADIIRTALDVLQPGCSCTLIAVDAFTGQGPKELEKGWSRLRDTLNQLGINSSLWSFPYASLNPSGSRRLASLYPPS